MTTRKISLFTAISVVIANMVGTGVFTSLGFQLSGIQSVFAIIMLWFVGGIVALCGALSYGELSSAMPRSGGEYHYLSVLLHPLVGFLSGWISVTVGFAAPVALAAMALSQYLNKVYPVLNPTMIAAAVVVVTTILHCFSLKNSARFQDITTVIKILLILFFIIAGLLISTHQAISILPANSSVDSESWKSIFSRSFAVSLIYVSYAYSGWNAAAYMANDVENPHNNVPKSLIFGTIIVMVLYVLLNYVFLYTAPISEMKGQLEVGYISGTHIFGANAGSLMSIMIAIMMVSSVSSYIFAGPRISRVMGEDLKPISFLSKTNKNNVPVIATVIQSSITLLLIGTSSFEKVMLYVGFTLNLFTFLTVTSLFVMRITRKDLQGSYKTFGYPVTPLIFLTLSGWTIYSTMHDHPIESLFGMITISAGSVIYFIGKNKI